MSDTNYDISKLFTERLIKLRKAKKLTQKEFAESIGCTQAKFCKWETGVNRPNFEGLRLIAKSLNTTTDYLLGLCEHENIEWEVLGFDPELINKIMMLQKSIPRLVCVMGDLENLVSEWNT